MTEVTYYPRTTDINLKDFEGLKVELVGYVVKQDNKKLTIEMGNKSLIEIFNFTQKLDIKDLIEIRGIVISKNKINFEEFNKLPDDDKDFDIKLFEKSLNLFNKYSLKN